MKQLQTTFAELDQSEGCRELVKRKHVQVRKPVALLTSDGRILGSVPRTKEEVIEDFWKRVKIGSSNECWEWQAGKASLEKGNNYGSVCINSKHRIAHRVAYEISKGKIPDGLLVCHSCDNPPCCNPDHLFLGTEKDNAMDAMQKGRLAKGDRNGSRLHPEKLPRGNNHWSRMHPEKTTFGEKHGRSKLTYESVAKIRQLFKQGELTKTEIAKQFGVTRYAINLIVTWQTWKKVI